MSVRLNGSTSGYTELDAPAVAGNNVLKLPANNGTNGFPIVTDGSGGLSFSQLTSNGLADGAVTAAKLSAGMVIKCLTYYDAGSSTSSTTFVNANQASFNYTPVSSSSTLLLIATFQSQITYLSGTTTYGYHSIGVSNSPLGSYAIGANSVAGIGLYSVASYQTSYSNTSTSNKQFNMMHRTSNSSAAVYTNGIYFTVLEVAN